MSEQESNRIRISRPPELVAEILATQKAGDSGQGPKMLDPGVRRRQQCEEQVHRQAVDGVEGYGLLEPNDHHPAAFQPPYAGMGGGDSPAKAGGPRQLPFQKTVKDHGGVETEVLGGLVGDEVHDLPGGSGAEADGHGAGPDQISDGEAILQGSLTDGKASSPSQ